MKNSEKQLSEKRRKPFFFLYRILHTGKHDISYTRYTEVMIMEKLREQNFSRLYRRICPRCGKRLMPEEEKIIVDERTYCRECGLITREERAFDLILTRYLK